MGREIKRVALDFDWPLNKIWEGFINPFYSKKCPEAGKTCFNGSTAAGQWLDAIVRFLMVAGDNGNGPRGNNCIWPHPYLTRFELAPTRELPDEIRKGGIQEVYRYYDRTPRDQVVVPPTKELTDLTTGLAGRAPCFLGHDACDQWSAKKKILEAAGVDVEKWGRCPICQGEGYDPAFKQQRDDWNRTEPPKGEGWQVWETVSEGSPVSPVFATAEELVEHLVGSGHSQAAAENFVKMGWVPSMMTGPGGLRSGIDCADVMGARKKEKEETDG
jgi:hypothetical protein